MFNSFYNEAFEGLQGYPLCGLPPCAYFLHATLWHSGELVRVQGKDSIGYRVLGTD
jgi:hypothetical protein